jgi:hypothetical protein
MDINIIGTYGGSADPPNVPMMSMSRAIHFQYPHLSRAQVYAALAYYYYHQNELDSEIQRRWQEVNEMAALEAIPRFSKDFVS